MILLSSGERGERREERDSDRFDHSSLHHLPVLRELQPGPDYESLRVIIRLVWPAAGLVPAEQRIYRLGLVVLLSLGTSSHATI